MTVDVVQGRAARGLPTVALVPVAALVWWVGGFLPWIVGGLGGDILVVNGYGRAGVPLFSGSIDQLVVGGGLGGVLAGLVARAGRERRAASAAAVVAGVGLALAIILVQSRHALSGARADIAAVDPRLVDGMSATLLVMTVLGMLLGLSALTGRIALGLALASVAGAVPVWSIQLAQAASDSFYRHADGVTAAARWAGAVVLVCALVAIGLVPLARLAWWAAALALAWIIGPSVTAVSYLGTTLQRGLQAGEVVQEHVSASLQVWRGAAGLDERPLTPWIVAIAVAVGLAVWLARPLGRRPRPQEIPRSAAPEPFDT